MTGAERRRGLKGDETVILIIGQNLAWQKVCTLPRFLRGEVNRLDEVREFASSKGPNVARALAVLGGRGEVIGYAGGATGRRVEEYLRAEGMECRLVRIAGETRTCTTLVEPDGTSTEVIEPPPRVSAEERARLREEIGERLGSARLLVLMGTAVEGETEDCYAALVRMAHDRGIPVIMDSACPQARRALEEAPEVIKINALELGSIAAMPADDLPERAAACRAIASRFGVRWLLITRGQKGIEAFDGRRLLHAAPPAVKVMNAIGSGDAAAAGVAWVVHEELAARGRDGLFQSVDGLREALLAATAMGTANCMNPVNGRVEPQDYAAVRQETRIEELHVP